MTTAIRSRHIVAVALFGVLLLALTPALTKAASLETITEEAKTADYQSLKSIVAYLTAYRDALEDGRSVPTTFVTALSGNLVRVDGTIVREHDSKMMEICGPMVKGEIDWGDGVKESLHGLGCSGDVHRFSAYHLYGTKGSFEVTVSGGAGRDASRVVAAGSSASNDDALLEVEVEGLTVTASGSVSLDDALPKSCERTAIATIFWGDGSSEQVTTDCVEVSYELAHEYAREGTYKVLIVDTDGDAAQELVTLEVK